MSMRYSAMFDVLSTKLTIAVITEQNLNKSLQLLHVATCTCRLPSEDVEAHPSSA